MIRTYLFSFAVTIAFILFVSSQLIAIFCAVMAVVYVIYLVAGSILDNKPVEEEPRVFHDGMSSDDPLGYDPRPRGEPDGRYYEGRVDSAYRLD